MHALHNFIHVRSSTNCITSYCKHAINEVQTPARLKSLKPLISFQIFRDSSSSINSKRKDSWKWIRNPENPRVKRLLEREDENLSAYLHQSHIRQLERYFYSQLRVNLTFEDQTTIPEVIRGYEYNYRYVKGKNFPIYVRRSLTFPHREEIVLDQNEMDNHEYHYVTGIKVAEDDSEILILLRNNYDEGRVFRRQFYRFKRSTLSPIAQLDGYNVSSAEYGPHHSGTIYATIADENRRPYKVVKVHLHDKRPSNLYKMETVYKENDPSFFVALSKTKDEKFLLVHAGSSISTEIRVLRIDEPSSNELILLRPREENVVYFADHGNDRFYIVTNAYAAENYQVLGLQSTSLFEKIKENISFSHLWRSKADIDVVLPSSDLVKIEDVDLLQNYLVLYESVAGLPRIRVRKLVSSKSCNDDCEDYFIPLPEEHVICTIAPGVNYQFISESIRFVLSTPAIPEIHYEFNCTTKQLTVLHIKEAPTAKCTVTHNNNIAVSRLHARSPINSKGKLNGILTKDTHSEPFVEVPITLLYRKDLLHSPDSINTSAPLPTLIVGYGAYGKNLELNFDPVHLELVRHGWIVALAHARGGGECGLKWHRDATKLNKRVTFMDFYACVLHLTQVMKLSTPDKLVLKGTSAGGLVMGVLANEYGRQLCEAIILKVPFLDILQTMLDPDLPLTKHEYDEWGDPSREPSIYSYMKDYSPCENIGQQTMEVHNSVRLSDRKFNRNIPYPSMWITGAINDNRVGFWEPLKFVTMLRRFYPHSRNSCDQDSQVESQHGEPKFLLKIDREGGHFGSGGQIEDLEDAAMELAFMYDILDLPSPSNIHLSK